MRRKMETRKFKYCVIGNIKKTHVDAEGILRHGTSAFTGGTKVFLCGKFWQISDKEIQVIGLTRGKKYQVHEVPVTLIENVRCSRTFRPWVLAIMDNWECWNEWWHDSKEDRKATRAFVSIWNRKDELNSLKGCAEVMKVTSIYSDSDYWWFLPDHTQLTYENNSKCFLDPAKGKKYDIVEWLCDDRVMVKLKD